MPQVTAIIPAYNRAALLPRALASVLHQTTPPHQVIVIDDGSTDNTAEVCRQYRASIEYVYIDNAGASAARNAGIARARHQWIAFLDSDDYWHPSHLERMSTAIRATQGRATLYFGDMQMPATEGGRTLWQTIGFQPQLPVHLAPDATAWALMKRQPMMLQASVIRREALWRVGGLDTRFRLMHDSYLFCRLAIGGPACAVAGLACIQTGDDTSLIRLSNAIPADSTAKAAEACTIWADVLTPDFSLPPPFTKLARYNAAAACWKVGMGRMRSGRYASAISWLLRAAAIDPLFVAWAVRRRTSFGYEDTVRPACSEEVPTDKLCLRPSKPHTPDVSHMPVSVER